jgi:hypothetical protein
MDIMTLALETDQDTIAVGLVMFSFFVGALVGAILGKVNE